jgi:hypothetical protein
MLSLLRNPLLRLLGRLWWLPVLTLLVAGLGLGGERGLRLASLAGTVYLGAIAGIVGTAWAHGTWTAFRQRRRRRAARHRFLCPHCLHFGDFQFSCGACGEKVEAFLVHTNGAYVNDCSNCHQPLFSRDGQDGWGVRAHCQQCQGNCNRVIHHERHIRVRATLLPDDFAVLCQAVGAPERQAQDRVHYTYADDGARLTYVLDLSTATDALRILPATHALWDVEPMWPDAAGKNLLRWVLELRQVTDPLTTKVNLTELSLNALTTESRAVPNTHALGDGESIWLDAARADPQELALQIAQAADRFIREAGLTERQRRALTVCVPQAAVHPAVQHALETRFGTIKYGVAAADFLGTGMLGTTPPQPASNQTSGVAREARPTREVN